MRHKIWTVWFLVSIVMLIWSIMSLFVMSDIEKKGMYILVWINFGVAFIYGATMGNEER